MSANEGENDLSDTNSFDEDDEDWSIKLEEDYCHDDDTAAELADLLADRDTSLTDLVAMYGHPDEQRSCETIKAAAREEESDESSVASDNLEKMLTWDSNTCSDEEIDPEYEPTHPHSSPRIGTEYQADVDLYPCTKPAYEPAYGPPVLFDFVDNDASMLFDYLASYSKMLKERKNPIPSLDVSRALNVLWQFHCKPGLALEHLKKELVDFYPENVEYTDIQLRMYPYNPQLPWEQQEVTAFENGIKMYGKNFRKIKDEILPYRALSDLTNFYYQFKLTERYKMLPKSSSPVIEKLKGYMTRAETAKNEEPIAGPSHAFKDTSVIPEFCVDGENDTDDVKVETITTFKATLVAVNGEGKDEATCVQKASKAGDADEETKAGENGEINSVHSVTGSYDM
ncbi:hypothetical protein M514_01009 [Trichuris suis]|uniref:SANT domain-containing protein n=1 Tax=Trichuris suis TaxID=68888 RepID=A0A085NM15_9BILA|nr:hypothetical protein M513_01009 [Trichuris suis]KFD70511.1 hypothetical protein M514_01009 [Trichuris suis]